MRPPTMARSSSPPVLILLKLRAFSFSDYTEEVERPSLLATEAASESAPPIQQL